MKTVSRVWLLQTIFCRKTFRGNVYNPDQDQSWWTPFHWIHPTCQRLHLHVRSLPSRGGSQLTLASQWESRKVMTSPLAAPAPSRRVLMSPSLFLVLRMRTFGKRFMYSSSAPFRCSEKRQTFFQSLESIMDVHGSHDYKTGLPKSDSNAATLHIS